MVFTQKKISQLVFDLGLIVDDLLIVAGIRVDCDSRSEKLGNFLEWYIESRLKDTERSPVEEEERDEFLKILQARLEHAEQRWRLEKDIPDFLPGFSQEQGQDF